MKKTLIIWIGLIIAGHALDLLTTWLFPAFGLAEANSFGPKWLLAAWGFTGLVVAKILLVGLFTWLAISYFPPRPGRVLLFTLLLLGWFATIYNSTLISKRAVYPAYAEVNVYEHGKKTARSLIIMKRRKGESWVESTDPEGTHITVEMFHTVKK